MYKRGEYFFYHNAASKMFKDKKYIYTYGQSFNKMFYNELEINTWSFSGVLTRKFESKYPTSDQAEVLINGFLSNRSIVEIVFNNADDKTIFLNKFGNNEIKQAIMAISSVDAQLFEDEMVTI